MACSTDFRAWVQKALHRIQEGNEKSLNASASTPAIRTRSPEEYSDAVSLAQLERFVADDGVSRREQPPSIMTLDPEGNEKFPNASTNTPAIQSSSLKEYSNAVSLALLERSVADDGVSPREQPPSTMTLDPKGIEEPPNALASTQSDAESLALLERLVADDGVSPRQQPLSNDPTPRVSSRSTTKRSHPVTASSAVEESPSNFTSSAPWPYDTNPRNLKFRRR
ncbi:hypothetical protein G7Y79_00020g048780 [Physcia stellaris]|nr:hypothetical protein G7Y79_00020g048780 [Physcia stellaris]